VNPREITVSKILQQVRRGKIEAVHAIADGAAEIIEAEVIATSSIVGKSMAQLGLPSGVLFGAILRDGQMIVPGENTVMMEQDHIIILAMAKMVRKVERIFSAGVEYF
jgi:trk system potassium uptake protein TrkA